MADGFEVVPEELERAADSIGDAVRDVAGMVWDWPRGDYGRPGLGSAFADFLEEIKDRVDTIHEDVLGHGTNLKDTATHYRDSDIARGDVVRNCWLPHDELPRGIMDTHRFGTGPSERELNAEGTCH
jgi:hypothetical protein